MRNTFKQTARFYDIDQHPPSNEDIPYYIEKASRFGSPILELACGTGRVTIPLAEAGYTVYGFDLSREMLGIFEQKRVHLPDQVADKITIKLGEMSDFSFNNRFKLILIPFHSFQALSSDEEALRCLNCIARHLHEDGALVLNVARFHDQFTEEWKEGMETQESIQILEDGQWMTRYTVLKELDKDQRLMAFENLYRLSGTRTKAEEYRDQLQIRYYEAQDLRNLLNEAGFQIIEERGGYDGSSIEDGDEMIFVCKKK